MPTTTLDRVAQAIGDPTRLEILEALRKEELTVGSIADGFAISRPAISQHLRVLRDADLVDMREEGTRNWYRARPAGRSHSSILARNRLRNCSKQAGS